MAVKDRNQYTGVGTLCSACNARENNWHVYFLEHPYLEIGNLCITFTGKTLQALCLNPAHATPLPGAKEKKCKLLLNSCGLEVTSKTSSQGRIVHVLSTKS